MLVGLTVESLRRQALLFGHMSNQPANCPDESEGGTEESLIIKSVCRKELQQPFLSLTLWPNSFGIFSAFE